MRIFEAIFSHWRRTFWVVTKHRSPLTWHRWPTAKVWEMTYLGFNDVHWAQRCPVVAVSYKRLHVWLFHLFCWKWLIIPQNIARRTWLTDSSLWFWERKMLRRLAARVRGKSRDWSIKSLEIVLMVAPRDKREVRHKDVTLKRRHPFSCDWKKKKEQESKKHPKWISGVKKW